MGRLEMADATAGADSQCAAEVPCKEARDEV